MTIVFTLKYPIPVIFRQHGGQGHVSLAVCWKVCLVLRCTEKEHRSLGFSVTTC